VNFFSNCSDESTVCLYHIIVIPVGKSERTTLEADFVVQVDQLAISLLFFLVLLSTVSVALFVDYFDFDIAVFCRLFVFGCDPSEYKQIFVVKYGEAEVFDSQHAGDAHIDPELLKHRILLHGEHVCVAPHDVDVGVLLDHLEVLAG